MMGSDIPPHYFCNDNLIKGGSSMEPNTKLQKLQAQVETLSTKRDNLDNQIELLKMKIHRIEIHEQTKAANSTK
jgi:outer membrane murein-binding lipoprotein Lpp